MLCCRHLEIHNNVWKGTLRFHFVHGPPNYVCLVAGYVLCFPVRILFYLKAEKRHWLKKREGNFLEGREYGDSGIFRQTCTPQGLCCHLSRQMRNALCRLSSGSITDKQLLSWSFCKARVLVKVTDQHDFNMDV